MIKPFPIQHNKVNFSWKSSFFSASKKSLHIYFAKDIAIIIIILISLYVLKFMTSCFRGNNSHWFSPHLSTKHSFPLFVIGLVSVSDPHIHSFYFVYIDLLLARFFISKFVSAMFFFILNNEAKAMSVSISIFLMLVVFFTKKSLK